MCGLFVRLTGAYVWGEGKGKMMVSILKYMHGERERQKLWWKFFLRTDLCMSKTRDRRE